MFSLFVFALLLKFSVQDMASVHPATSKGENNMSGGNFIYFFGPPATMEQLRSVREILKSDLVEMEQMKDANPVVRYLVKPAQEASGLDGEMNEDKPPHKHIGSLRKKRSPTYKKAGGGGGGGCCNSCGQCGGGCSGGGCGGGGGHSGSYSQSTSYSSSSSGSYSSNGKKK